MNIPAVLIDDESHNRSVLRTLIAKYCPDIDCIAEASSATGGYEQIVAHKPQLIFLDIKMPGGSGFDLLRRFGQIDFEVIFVSAFNEYAISAFEFNAVDYILKPIDYGRLQVAVDRAKSRIQTRVDAGHVLTFIQTLDEQSDLVNRISVHDRGRVILVSIADIVYLQALSDSTEIHLASAQQYLSSRSIKQFEEMLAHLPHFIRINKSILVNTRHIASYTKGEYCILTLDTGEEFEVSRRKKTDVLATLKGI
jgi:two-component system, LytTR family, response regulator